jgi:hypothetical protein
LLREAGFGGHVHIRDGNWELVEAALVRGVDPENITIAELPSFIWAIERGDVRHARALLSGRTALTADEAIEFFRRDRFDFLQKLKSECVILCMPDLSARSSTGTSVAEAALRYRTPEITEMLERWLLPTTPPSCSWWLCWLSRARTLG